MRLPTTVLFCASLLLSGCPGSESGSADEPQADKELRGAVELLRAGKPEEAVAALNARVEAEPTNTEAWIELGWAHWSLEQWAEAVTAWESAVEAGAEGFFLQWLPEARMRRDGLLPEVSTRPDADGPRVDARVIRLALAGALFPGGQLNVQSEPALPADDGRGLLNDAERFLMGADLSIGLLATACSASGRLGDCGKAGAPGCATGRSPKALCATLARSGVTLFSLQSPAAGGLGPKGRQSSAKLLQSNGADVVGLDGAVGRARVGSVTVRVLALGGHDGVTEAEMSPGLNEILAESGEEVLVVSVYRGSMDDGDFGDLARALIDAGADLVVGHAGPELGPLEIRKDRLIAYNLGTLLMFGGEAGADDGLAMVLNLDLASTGEFLGGNLVPLLRDVDGVPRDDPDRGAVQRVRRRSTKTVGKSKMPRISDNGTLKPLL